ncbi:MAG: hypothetical protein WA160_10700 [Pseudobdellovibrio sp.]
MLKIISLVLQLILLKKSFTKQTLITQHLDSAVCKAKMYFLVSLCGFISLLFLIISCVVAIISVGLQLDQRGSISFTGLMFSASIFCLIGVLAFVLSLVILFYQKYKIAIMEKEKQKKAEAGSLMPMVEDFIKQIFSNLSKESEDNKPK